jgi:hypothetical protein
MFSPHNLPLGIGFLHLHEDAERELLGEVHDTDREQNAIKSGASLPP